MSDPVQLERLCRKLSLLLPQLFLLLPNPPPADPLDLSQESVDDREASSSSSTGSTRRRRLRPRRRPIAVTSVIPLRSRVGEGVIGETLLGLPSEGGFTVTSTTGALEVQETSSSIVPQIFTFSLT